MRAKPIIRGQTYMVTRVCNERKRFLQPGEDAAKDRELMGYLYAVAGERSGVGLHAASVQSNHKHDMVTDHRAKLPRYKNMHHAWVAKSFNAKRGRFDKFWRPGGSVDTKPQSDTKLLEQMVYILTNPVKDGEVKWARLWPGFSTYGWKFGETRAFRKPKDYFDADNPDLPEVAYLTLERPKIMMHLSDEELYELMMKMVRERELEIQAQFKKEGRRFKGVQKLMKQRWNEAPRSHQERYGIRPKYAGKSKWEVLAGLQRDRKFEREYAATIDALLAGDRDVVFPYGTYWMVHFANMNAVANGPPP